MDSNGTLANVRGRARRISLLLVACLLAACTSVPVTSAPPTSPEPSIAPSAIARASLAPRAEPTATPTAKALPHVFVIVMENTGLARALRSAPIASLASRYVVTTGYHAVARPSLPNYLAMTSGSTWGITDNGYYALPATGIGTQLTAAGIPWRAYMEGMTAGCMRSPYPYALKHNPFAYYGGGCPENVVNLDSLEADLAGATPNFVFVTPGLCNDGHDCSINQAGAWLDGLAAKIVASRAWTESGVLFIAWDEGDGGDANLVPLIVATPSLTARQIDGAYDHYSLLATMEDLFGLPRLGAAASARSLLPAIGPRG